jgi:hypothetical protein
MTETSRCPKLRTRGSSLLCCGCRHACVRSREGASLRVGWSKNQSLCHRHGRRMSIKSSLSYGTYKVGRRSIGCRLCQARPLLAQTRNYSHFAVCLARAPLPKKATRHHHPIGLKFVGTLRGNCDVGIEQLGAYSEFYFLIPSQRMGVSP